MASLKSARCIQVPLLYHFQLIDGMELQVNVSGYLSGRNAKVKLQLRNCSSTWTLHWGCISNGNKKWFIPADCPSGTRVYKQKALRTPFLKNGDTYIVVIELRDPKIHAIEFVLKDVRHDKWLKMKGGNFHIKLPEGSDVLFGICFDQSILSDLKLKERKAISIRLNSTNINSSDLSLKPSRSSSTLAGLSSKKKTFRSIHVVSLEESNSEMVGAKSYNIKFLSGKVPSWIKLPTSIILPFGVFEKLLSEDINKELAKKICCFTEDVERGDLSKLRKIQELVLQMNAPLRLAIEFKSKMKSSRIPWPVGEGKETWNRAWEAMKKVWASKWNERAYISCRKVNMNHDKLSMAILIQEIISADYAFVTYTVNPVSGDTSEIYTEIVKGLSETLVGAYPGRAMSFITTKSNLKSPTVIAYPSKSIGLFIKTKRSIIFRSDFNAADLKGYAGAGLFDSVSMDKEEEVVLDYSNDPMIVDVAFQTSLCSRIAEAGKIIEDLYGCAQDIEGVVKDGQIYVVQSRPLILNF